MYLPDKKFVASFDVDAQKTFTPICPNELPVAGGDEIVDELNAQAQFASLRIASRDAHSMSAFWLANDKNKPLTPIVDQENCDLYWPAHAIVGTIGFDFLDGLDPQKYDYQVYKGIQDDMHPYGACYHDFTEELSTGVVEYLKQNDITTVIVGGLATDYCVKTTVLQLLKANFKVILNLAACRGIQPETTNQALELIKQNGGIIIENSTQLTQVN